MRLTRHLVHLWQRRTRGFDESVTWNLDWEFQKWILPRLKRYKQVASEAVVLTAEFEQAIDDMIEGFDVENLPWDEVGQAKLQKAYDQFAKYHGALWW